MNLSEKSTKESDPRVDPSTQKRQMVRESINSISKAVADLVSLSCHEEFRSSVLQIMEVRDTVELKAAVADKLGEICKRCHGGLWTQPLADDNRPDIKPTATQKTANATVYDRPECDEKGDCEPSAYNSSDFQTLSQVDM